MTPSPQHLSHDSTGDYHSKTNDTPAYITPDGTQYFYFHGKLHREDNLPAVIHPDGSLEYWFFGSRHREGLPQLPAVIRKSGELPRVEYWLYGKLHREDENQPAVISDDGELLEYYQHGKRHRLDGPALIRYDSHSRTRMNYYYVNGEFIRKTVDDNVD